MMVNHLSVRQNIGKTWVSPAQGGAQADTNQSPRDPVQHQI